MRRRRCVHMLQLMRVWGGRMASAVATSAGGRWQERGTRRTNKTNRPRPPEGLSPKSQGKERKGKERKGKERKGKEEKGRKRREGKERKGKKGKGREGV